MMPLFGSRREVTPPPAASNAAPQRKSVLFSRNKDIIPAADVRRTTTKTTKITTHRTASSPKRHSGLLSRGSGDPSVAAAKQSLVQAEAAEREADRALFVAKNAVREAREHVHRIECEAAEEARLAKIKQGEAKALGRQGRALGRHDHV